MIPLSLTFVGSGDAFSSGGRLQSGIFIAAQAGGLLLDCGATVLAGLQRCGLCSNQIDSVVISHLHGDHFAGIPFLLLDGLFVQQRTKPLHIIGPAGTEERVSEACRLLYPRALSDPLPFSVDYQVLGPRQSLAGDFFTLTAFAVRHGSSSAACSVRVEIEDRVIAYSGDTAWTNALIALAQGSDLFICECCNFDKSSPAHLDYLTLKEHLAELETARIILTHTGPQIDANHLQIELEIASDGLQLQLQSV